MDFVDQKTDRPGEIAMGAPVTVRWLIFFAMVACGTSHGEECSEQSPETFSSFFKQYIADRDWALERTVFPLKYSVTRGVLDSVENGREFNEDKLTKSRGEYAKWLPLADWISGHQYSIKMSLVENEVMKRVRIKPRQEGMTQGQRMYDFEFKRRAGCWRLVLIEENVI